MMTNRTTVTNLLLCAYARSTPTAYVVTCNLCYIVRGRVTYVRTYLHQ